MSSRLTILLSGMIAADPHQGGATWAVLQYLLGFRKLGHEVYFVEPVQAAALRPVAASLEASINARYFRQVVTEFGLEKNAALLLAGTQKTVGMTYDRLEEVARRTDVLVNISGLLTDQELRGRILPCRVYPDLDPGFTQLWHAAQGIDMRFTERNWGRGESYSTTTNAAGWPSKGKSLVASSSTRSALFSLLTPSCAGIGSW